MKGKRAKMKKGIVCLVILLILISLVPSTAVSEDVSDRSIDLQDNYDLSPEMKRGDNIIPKAEVPTYEFLTYANFGSDNSGYTPGHGVGGYSDKLYVAVNGNCYVYSVTIPAGEDPDMHPNNPEDPGPMATRSLSLIEIYNFGADCGWYGGHHAEFYIDENHIYYGPDYFGVGGIEKWAKTPDGTFGTYLGRVKDKDGNPIPVPPTNGETFTYDPTINTWYTCTRGREVYSFDMAVDTSWQYEFKYPSYEGGHHDGLEYVNGFLWISDMTTNWIGQWRKNPDGSWEEIARFYYDNPVEDEVEGMGFGPLGHLWVTGWNRLYEIGGKELGEVIKGIELSMTLDKTIYNPKEILDIHLKITDKDECCTFPISMYKIEIKIDDKNVNIEDGRIDKAIEWAENKLGSHDYDGYCWRFVVHAYKKQAGVGWTLPPQGSAKQAANSLEPLKTSAPPCGALAFYDSVEAPEHGHVGLSLGDTNGNGKTEIIHAYTEQTGVIISDDYNNIGGCTYIGWSWPPIKIIYANKEYLIKAKAPSEKGDHTVWVQVVTDLGSANDFKSFSVFEPFTFVQVTDVHIGCLKWLVESAGCTRSTKKSIESFTNVIDGINTLKPKFVLVSGDLVEYNPSDFFYKFKNILCSLDSICFYHLPGNHDRRTNPFWGDDNLKNYHECIRENGPRQALISPDNYTFEYNGYLFVGLDSGKDYYGKDYYVGRQPDSGRARLRGWAPRGSGLSDSQLDALEDPEKIDPSVPKIIFMHHPAINDRNSGCIADNQDRFIEYCEDSKVKLVLTGHTHEDKIFNADRKRVGRNSNDRPLFIQTASVKAYSKCRVIQVIGHDDIVIWPSTDQPICWKRSIWIDGIDEPVLHAYDSQDRHTGIDGSGNIVHEIPHSYYIGNYGTMNLEGIVLHDANENYKLTVTLKDGSIVPLEEKVQQSENQSFNLTITNQTADFLTTISYNNVNFTENTTATVHLNKTATNYTMMIDYTGDNITDETKDPDSIETDYAPTATINSPVNNSTYLFGEEIVFNGTGIDPEDGVLTNNSLVWSSDLYGMIGIGNEFNNSNLSVGKHNITLRVNDTLDQMNTSTVSIFIRSTQPDMFIDILKADETPGIEQHLAAIEALADQLCNLRVYINNTGYGTLNNVQVLTNVGINKDVGEIKEGESKQVSIEFTPTIPGLVAFNATVKSDEIERNASRALLVQKFDFTVSIPKTQYDQNEPVPINISVTNEVPNMRFIDAKIEINISNSHFNHTFKIPLLSLGPMVTKNTTFTWDTTGVNNGAYTIVTSLVIAEQEVLSDEKNVYIGTEPPIANANGPYRGVIEYIAVPITFDGTGSYDPDGTIVSYEWDLDNDGKFDDAVGATPTVSFTAPYSGNIHLKVTDNNGATDTDTTTLTITKHSPPPNGIHGGLLTPPEQPQYYCGTSTIQGKGYFTIDERIQDWATAIDSTEHIEGTGEFEMTSKKVLDQAANTSDFYDPNFYHQKTMKFQGNATNRLISREKFESSGIFGGTGTRINEYFDVSMIQKDESSSIKTISAPGSVQSHRFATMDDFSGIWSIHSDWQKICQKEIRHHQMFIGNFSVQKDLTFEREIIMP